MNRMAFFVRTVCTGSLSLLMIAGVAGAEQPYPLAWSKVADSSGIDHARSVAVDVAGNAWMTGITYGDLGGPNLGSSDAYLLKYDGTGSLLFSVQIGTSTADSGWHVAVDSSCKAFVVGRTMGDLGGMHIGGTYDGFISKYSSSGDLLWSRQIGTTSNDEAYSVAVDAGGNAFVTGYTSGSLGGINPNAPWDEAVLIKYSPLGDVVWSRQIGTTDHEQGFGVATDSCGNAFIAGYTQGSLAADNAGGQDGFLAKYDGAGGLLWKRQIGTAAYDIVCSVATDASGNAFIAGKTGGAFEGTDYADYDAYVAKYDPDGNLLWLKQFGTAGADSADCLAVDADGNIFVGGTSQGGLGGSAGDTDAFVLKFDTSGSLIWSQEYTTLMDERDASVALDPEGSVFLGGTSAHIVPSPAPSTAEVFLARYTVPEPASLLSMSLGAALLLRKRR